MVEEDAGVPQLVDERGGAAVGEQRGVGGEHPLPRLEVHEVVAVERHAAARVHRHHRRVVVWVLLVTPALPLHLHTHTHNCCSTYFSMLFFSFLQLLILILNFARHDEIKLLQRLAITPLINRLINYLEESGVGWVEGRVDVAGVVLSGEVEEPRAEKVAVPDSDGVPAYINRSEFN